MERFRNILCVIEVGIDNNTVIEQAIRLAENNQARLTLMSVPLPATSDIQQTLEKLASDYRQHIEIDVDASTETTYIEVIRKVLREEHDLVIKGPEIMNGSNHAFSEDDKQLLRKCPCPVWMNRLQKGHTYHRILAAVDVDDNCAPAELKTRQDLSESVMALAGYLAMSEFAELSVVSTWEVEAESAIRFAPFISRPESEVDAYVEKARQHHTELMNAQLELLNVKLGPEMMDYIKPKLHCIKGAARENIPKLAKQIQADCIVMGTIGRVGIHGLIIGNTAESLLDQLSCSVLAIKPKGFVTPVTLAG
jgi:nucleotide-binding universal stress UspA family protein